MRRAGDTIYLHTGPRRSRPCRSLGELVPCNSYRAFPNPAARSPDVRGTAVRHTGYRPCRKPNSTSHCVVSCYGPHPSSRCSFVRIVFCGQEFTKSHGENCFGRPGAQSWSHVPAALPCPGTDRCRCWRQWPPLVLGTNSGCLKNWRYFRRSGRDGTSHHRFGANCRGFRSRTPKPCVGSPTNLRALRRSHYLRL